MYGAGFDGQGDGLAFLADAAHAPLPARPRAEAGGGAVDGQAQGQAENYEWLAGGLLHTIV